MEWAITILNRFLIGDGTAAHGYAFGHPRFGYYFADRLTEKEREQWQGRFLHYGRETLAALENRTLKPREASA